MGAFGRDDGSRLVAAIEVSSRTRANSSRGEFWYRHRDDEAFAPSVTLQTDVSMNVSGLIVRVEVRQAFSNPSDEPVEGIYVFPLPDSAAVDHLRMRVGERPI